ncbi:Gfo/Idh/MocA family protein [Sporobolomyces koalae]|uniref:Gfo/Idh/MocA family protein n=1 Tax=Sporobolomyces koalae TaxID=500713 RepID=UPI00317757E3
MPFRCKWGILSTGWIAQQFTHDLLVDPSTRNTLDVEHEIVAVASRSRAKADEFVRDLDVADAAKPKTYGSYAELFQDQTIDVVYVATPHSHHYRNVYDALTAGKNVLCEKPIAVTAAQARTLAALARKQNVFLMEAVWTRFQPYAYKLEEVLASGAIGEIRGAQAELCVDFGPTAARSPDHRLVNPDLAGGALLDLGPYPWTQLCLALRPETDPTAGTLKLPKLAASMTKTSSGVDASTIAAITFAAKDGQGVHGTFTAAQDRQSAHSRVLLVQGSHGYLETRWPTFRPSGFSYKAWDSVEDFASGEKPPTRSETFDFESRPGDILGFAWEADEVARCLRDGRKESARMPLNETVLMMETFDEMRRQGQLVYPEALETEEVSQAPA